MVKRGWWWVALTAAVARAVTVDGNTALVLGEQRQVSANLFGVTAFTGLPEVAANADYRARLAALQPGCVRLPGNVAWCSPAKDDTGWYGSLEAERAFTTPLLFGNRYPYGRLLSRVREVGAEPLCSLGGPPAYLQQPGSDAPADFDRWAEHCAGYVGLWRWHDPRLRLVQIWNEPNASWFRDPRVKREGPSAAQLHVEMANKVARALKQRFPDLRVGGPVLCWPPCWPAQQAGQQPWYTWDQWTLPWLSGTRDDLDFFDFHVYDVSPDDFAVQAEMLANAARRLQGRRLPIWITESNYTLTTAEQADPQQVWTKRALPYERFLLGGVLPQADKVDGNLVHDLHAGGWTLLPNSDEPGPLYRVLWILRDLRGTRLLAESDTPGVTVAATCEDDRLTVVLFNDTAGEQDVPLKVALRAGWWTGPEVRAIGVGGQPLALTPKLERTKAGAEGTVTLPARATAALNFRVDHLNGPARTQWVRERFGSDNRVLLSAAPRTLELPGDGLPAGATVRLRVGLLGVRDGDTFAATLNGVALALKATALQEVEVDPATLQAVNRLELRCTSPTPSSALALGFASLVVRSAR